MEIHNQPTPPPRPSPGSKDWPKVDVTRINRDWIQRTTDDAIDAQRPKPSELDAESTRLQQSVAAARAKATREAAEAGKSEKHTDRLELSDEATRLAEQASHGAEPSEAELARVRELRTQYENGELNTYERVQRAAERMLGGS